MEFRSFYFFISKLWRPIPDDYGCRLSEAKPAEKGECIPLLTAKYELDMVKTDRDNDVTKCFFDFWRKVQSWWRHPGRRESRIHFRFSVSGRAWPILLELLVRYGWKRVLQWKIARKKISVVFFKVWLAIPDVHGRQLSEAKLAEEGGAPLLTTKYEPTLVGSDRAWTWDFSVFRNLGVLGNLFFWKRLGNFFSNFAYT